MVNAQKLLVDHFGIRQLYAVAGGSMGGMQVMQWAVTYPDSMKKADRHCFHAGIRHPSRSHSTRSAGRQSSPIPTGTTGTITGRPSRHGLALARMVGHITYLSNESMHEKFGRALQGKDRIGFDFSTDFKVESYLHHQGDTFTLRFDANSYLYITKAIDYFDLTQDGSLTTGLTGVKASFLIISVSSDWLYPPYQSQEMLSALTANEAEVHYCEIRSNYGHDAFLLESGQIHHLCRQIPLPYGRRRCYGEGGPDHRGRDHHRRYSHGG